MRLKISLTVFVLIIGGGIAFLSLSGRPSDEQSFEMDMKVGKGNEEEIKNKSEVVREELKKEKEVLFEDGRRTKKREVKLSFDAFFREDEENPENKKTDAVREIRANAQKENKSQSRRSAITNNSKQAKKVVKEESMINEENVSSGLGGTFGRKEKEASTSEIVNSVNTEKEVRERFVKAILYGDNKIKRGSRVEFRILEDFETKRLKIKKNKIIGASVISVGNRIKFRIDPVNESFHSLKIYDLDYREGLFYEGTEEENKVYEGTKDEFQEDILSGTGINELEVANRLIRGAERISSSRKADKILLYDGRIVLIKY